MEDKFIVEFKFRIGEEVITPFGEKGIVSMLGNDGNIVYYVKTSKSECWFKEYQLK